MANNYCQFSCALEAPTPKEIKWLKKKLEELEEQQEDDYEGMNFQANIEIADAAGGKMLWIHADESGSPDDVANFVQAFLVANRPKDSFVFSWSFTCSKPRLDEFGGGACFVTAKKMKFFDAQSLAGALQEKHNKKK